MKRNAMFGAAIAALVIIVVMAYIAMNALGNQGPVTPENSAAIKLTNVTAFGVNASGSQVPSASVNSSEPLGWGLSGMVYDQNRVAIPGAMVTIYKSVQDAKTGAWVNLEKLNVKGDANMSNDGNPQLSSNGSLGAPGSYMFICVPAGTYNVTAEKDGHLWYANIQWGEGALQNVDIAIPDYTYIPGEHTVTPGSLAPAPKLGPWGTIWGTVMDENGTPVPNATVTLWAYGYDSTGKEANLGKAVSTSDPRNFTPNNPQFSSDGLKSAPGTYTFYKVPWGRYNVTAEKDGKIWSSITILGQGGQFGTDTCDVKKLPYDGKYGTISGIVTDQNKIGIPGANVTLWTARWDSTMDAWVNDRPASVSHNPQSTNNGSSAAPGMYTFYTVPWGMYNVTAEKDGYSWYSVLLLGPADAYKSASNIPGPEYGTATHNIAIPDYNYTPGP